MPRKTALLKISITKTEFDPNFLKHILARTTKNSRLVNNKTHVNTLVTSSIRLLRAKRSETLVKTPPNYSALNMKRVSNALAVRELDTTNKNRVT